MTEQSLKQELDDISLEVHLGRWRAEAHVEMSFTAAIGQPAPTMMVLPHAETPAEAKRMAWRCMRYRFLRLAAVCNPKTSEPIPDLDFEHWSALLRNLPLPLEFELVAMPNGSDSREKTTAHCRISLASDNDPAQQTVMIPMEILHPATAPHPKVSEARMWTHMRDRFLRLADKCGEASAEEESVPEDEPSGESIGLLTHGRT